MIDADECHVWWVLPRPDVAARREVLSPSDRARATRYRRAGDRLRFLTGRVALRLLLGAYLAAPPASVPLQATCRHCGGPHGKPRLLTRSPPPLEFSVAHAGDRVAVVVAPPATRVGIDVERIRPAPLESGLMAGVLTPSEQRCLGSLAAADRPRAMAAYWTRKEAVLKAEGSGMAAGPESVAVSPPGQPPRLLEPETAAWVPRPLRLHDLDPGPAYAASLAALTDVEPVVRQRWWVDVAEDDPYRLLAG